MNKNVEIGRAMVQNSPELFIDIDVEADGIAGKGSLLSIGAIDPWGATFYREIKPMEENGFVADYRDFIDPDGTLGVRLRREGGEVGEVISDFANWALRSQELHKKTGTIALVGFNASYDFPLINLEYMRAGVESPFGFAGYCIKSLAMALGKDTYSWKQAGKSGVLKDFLPEGEFTHHALDDAKYQQFIHYGLVGELYGNA